MGSVQDLICVGFGPASVALAIAIQESSASLKYKPKVSFLELQPEFAWHAGMQIPGASMQISFMKDLATPRNPQSHFTFINYLHSKGRLNNFINLSTFTPSRWEFGDYLKWCAGHFDRNGQVAYSQEVLEVSPDVTDKNGQVTRFRVVSRDTTTGKTTTRLSRHVVIAVGGRPALPKEFQLNASNIVHSSKYAVSVDKVLPNPAAPYSIAVIGNGQSAAEIFDDLSGRYPNANVTMFIKQSALTPSDDSPFVNEIFDPDRVDGVYKKSEAIRLKEIEINRATNYGVVRLDLLEHLYNKLYMQKLKQEDPKKWKFNIRTNRKAISVSKVGEKIKLVMRETYEDGQLGKVEEEILADAVFVATGYIRNTHESMLKNTRSLLSREAQAEGARIPVKRDYSVQFDAGKVSEDAGVWLQGCNEKTHGVRFDIMPP
jgi:L-ornithine N5-oxygenase